MLKDCDFRFYLPEHKTQEIIGKAGEIISFEEPFEHLPENLTDKPFEAVLIELVQATIVGRAGQAGAEVVTGTVWSGSGTAERAGRCDP